MSLTIRQIRGELIRCQKNSTYDEAKNMFEMLKAFEQQTNENANQKQPALDLNCWNMMISLCERDLDLTYVLRVGSFLLYN